MLKLKTASFFPNRGLLSKKEEKLTLMDNHSKSNSYNRFDPAKNPILFFKSDNDWSILCELFKKILEEEKPEKNILDLLDKILLFKDKLSDFYNLSFNITINENRHATASLLLKVMFKKYKNVALKLIQHGIPLEEGLKCESAPSFGGTPLVFACQYNELEIATALIDQGANLLTQISNGNSPLMVAGTKEICTLILDRAKKQNCLEKLLSLKKYNNLNAFEIACLEGNIDVLTELCNIPEFEAHININELLHGARFAYFSYPEKCAQFAAICTRLRELQKIEHKLVIPELSAMSEMKLEDAYVYLFGTKIKSDICSKQEAVKFALAQIFSLLHTPRRCVKYLAFLNKEFLRYYRVANNKEFPSIDPTTYEFSVISDTYYPIPKDNYIGIKKQSSLQEFLISLFHKHGLASVASKWIGFVSTEVANEALARGDFIVEGRLGPGLFHHKISHMLQQAIILYAIENNEISLQFKCNNNTVSITVADILSGLIFEKTSREGTTLWQTIRDSHCSKISFCDPHRFGSTVAQHGKQIAMGALAGYLTDTFCKGLFTLVSNYKEQPSLRISLGTGLAGFLDKMNDIHLRLFNTPNYLIQRAAQLDSQKNKTFSQKTQAFVVTRKSYKPHAEFKPLSFTNSLVPLPILAINNDLDAIRSLLTHSSSECKFDLDETLEHGETAVWLAAAYGYSEILDLLAKSGANLSKVTKSGEAAIHCATKFNQLDSMKILLNPAYNLKNQLTEGGQTALFLATDSNLLPAVELLLEHNAELKQTDSAKSIPLMCAATKGNLDILKVLMKHKNSLMTVTKSLFIAAQEGHADIVDYLLNTNHKPDSAIEGKISILLEFAAEHNRTSEVTTLFQQKNLSTIINHLLPIHIAAFKGHYKIIERLIAANADITLEAEGGLTAIDFANVMGHQAIVDLLRLQKSKLSNKQAFENTTHSRFFDSKQKLAISSDQPLGNERGQTLSVRQDTLKSISLPISMSPSPFEKGGLRGIS